MTYSRLDRHLAYLDYLLDHVRASVEVAYILDHDEPTKEAKFRRLDHLIAERDRIRRVWAYADALDPNCIPLYDPLDLIA